MNRISLETKQYILKNNYSVEETKEKSNKFNYGKMLEYQEDYHADKQYFDYDNTELQKEDISKKDENGIILTKYNNEYIYNPVTISQYGLNQYSNYIETGDESYYNKSKKQAEYLLNIQDKTNGKFYYEYDFKVSGTNTTLKSPWSSAMAQGQVISLFVRIYSKDKEEKYITAARLAMKPLEKDVKEGGLCTSFFGYDYYEEYPTDPPSYTLNGFMFTLIGLHDLYSITNDKQAEKLYKSGINTLEYCLPFYDCNGISLYHLGHITDKKLSLHYAERYHKVHIIELKTINQFEKNEVFSYYIKKWEQYIKENS